MLVPRQRQYKGIATDPFSTLQCFCAPHLFSAECIPCTASDVQQQGKFWLCMCRWGQKPAVQPQPVAGRPPSPSTSLTSRSYSSDSRSSSRSRSPSRSASSSRSRSSSRSPDSRRRGYRAGKRHRLAAAGRGSPSNWQGKAKKFKQAGPPETKKQRYGICW